MRTQGNLGQSDEERLRLQRELASASQQLNEERATAEKLMVARTELEVCMDGGRRGLLHGASQVCLAMISGRCGPPACHLC